MERSDYVVERTNHIVERNDFFVERNNFSLERSDLERSDHGTKWPDTHPNLVVTCGPVVVLWTRKRKSFYVGMYVGMYVCRYVGMWQDGLDLMREDIRRQLIALHQRQQWH